MGETVNKIFAKNNVLNTAKSVQKIQYNREYLLSSTAKEFNTYLNMGVFPTFADTYVSEYEEKIEGDGENKKITYVEKEPEIGTSGVRSLFNKAGAVILSPGTFGTNIDPSKGDDANTADWRISNNVPLMDSPEARKRIREKSSCSISDLVKASESGELGRATYSYSDFMFCKHLGKMPNNYLITLRRFPLPVDDYITAMGNQQDQWDKTGSNNASCIGCMVTWIGVSGNTMEGLLKYSYNQPFKVQNAVEQDVQNADENTSKLNGIFSIFDENYRKAYAQGRAGEAANGILNSISIKGKKLDLGNPPYKGTDYWDFRDNNKVYGPIDSIRSTYIRSDEGLTFEQKLSLVFEYELRSYYGVNGRQAMLDLISNILNITYTTGTFWGGGYKATGAHQSNVFNNLEVFKCNGGFTDFVEAFSKDLSNGANATLKAFNNPVETIKNVFKQFNSIGGMLLGGMLNNLGRPHKQMFHSLLSPAPIGFWHVMIGNPKHPIMSIGNMVITNVSIEHNGPLGIDDFPTGLKVTVELDRGKPRDLRDIEKLYMQGNDRIFHSMGPKIFDMYYNAEEYKSKGINYTPKTNIVNINNTDSDPIKPTKTIGDLTKLKSTMKKYFGTEDLWSVYIPAAEQEFGAGKKQKPSTTANTNITGSRNGK